MMVLVLLVLVHPVLVTLHPLHPLYLEELLSVHCCKQQQVVLPFATTSELSSYLDSDNVNMFDDDFNILNWWRDHKHTYPVLSILAKDVLSVPVSTISSESAFSLTGRIIEERRRRLALETVEMLSCVKDWEAGDARAQHSVEDKELEATFDEMYLDGQNV